MIFLFLSILFNSYLGVIFAYFNKYKIDSFQAIVFNYWTCVITGTIVLGHFPINTESVQYPWFKWAILMGFLFITVFNLISISSVNVGITITQTSNKLSLVIPVLFSFLIYHEQISWIKLTGLSLALIAVILTSKSNNNVKDTQKTSWVYLLPVILFISSGIIDTLTKYVERTFLTSNETSNAYLISGFFVAAIFGSFVLSYQLITSKRVFHFKHLFAGIVLGIPNYFSIYFLIKSLQSDSLSSSAIIPINNIGVLFVVSMFGIFIFNEKLNKANYLGLFFTLIAILLIFLGDKY